MALALPTVSGGCTGCPWHPEGLLTEFVWGQRKEECPMGKFCKSSLSRWVRGPAQTWLLFAPKAMAEAGCARAEQTLWGEVLLKRARAPPISKGVSESSVSTIRHLRNGLQHSAVRIWSSRLMEVTSPSSGKPAGKPQLLHSMWQQRVLRSQGEIHNAVTSKP